MNNYEARQEAKRDKYYEKARKASERSSSHYQASRSAVDGIPFGQPILVGHHSESKHRNAIAKAHRNMDKSVEESKKADYYERKAERVGTGGISKHDPDAIKKLKEKLNGLEESHKLMKDFNAAWRKAKKPAPTEENAATWAEIGKKFELTAETLSDIIKTFAMFPYWKQPFAKYALSNSNQNIASVKKRIAELEKREQVKTECVDSVEPIEGNGFELTYDEEFHGINIEFNGKPSEEVRTYLKSLKFKWSRYQGVWYGKFTTHEFYQGMSEKLSELMEVA